MQNIYEILARAAALRDETQLNSISPERAGGIMYDTLLALNDLWLQQGGALVISKIYASVAAMEADTAPVSDLTGQPLRPGQIVVIASSDSDNGSVYRYNGTDSPSWSLVGEIGNLEPVDSLDSDSTQLPLAAHQGKVLDGKISQLGQEFEENKPSVDEYSLMIGENYKGELAGKLIESDEWIFGVTDSDGKIIVAIDLTGNIFYGLGVPPQVKKFLNQKVDKEQGKSLIDSYIVNSIKYIESAEFIETKTDSTGALIEAILPDGTKKFYRNVDIRGIKHEVVDNPEWLFAYTDLDDRILVGLRKNGIFVAKIEAVEELRRDNQEIREELSALKDVFYESVDVLPDYYNKNDYLANKLRVINERWLRSKKNADMFLFFTDAHYYANYKKGGVLIEYVLKNSCIRKAFYGGDTASNLDSDIISSIVFESEVAKKIVPYANYMAVRGNHDYYNNNELLTYEAVRNNILNSINVENIVIGESDNSLYYYFDEKFSKIRYIFIDTFDPSNPQYIAPMNISDAQFAFIANALNTTPEGYCNVIIAHTSPQNGMMHDITEYERAENLRLFLSAFQNRQSVTINNVTYDFTNAVSNIVMYVAGHSHEDMQNYVDGTLYVSVPCDSWNSNSTAAMHTYHPYPSRTGGTINEQCIDVSVFDRNNNVADFVRIGWGFNRKFNLTKNTVQVGSSISLESSFDVVSQWLIHDSQGATYNPSAAAGTERWTFTNNVATIDSSGVVTALSAGECYAIAIAENGDKEFFYIKVNN